MQQYIRVRRGKATYFLTCEPTDTVLACKGKLAGVLGKTKDAVKDMRLQMAGKATNVYLPLEDVAVLEQLNLGNDSVVYLSFFVHDGT
jgi:hypothetical protein